MDVDAMTTEERDEMMRAGLCFRCKKAGHVSRNCPNRNRPPLPQQTPQQTPPKKMKGKELHAHVRALMAQMEEDDVDEFLKESGEQGF